MKMYNEYSFYGNLHLYRSMVVKLYSFLGLEENLTKAVISGIELYSTKAYGH